LVRVARDGAFAERLLASSFARTELSPRDRAWLTELVYGTLRHVAWLDAQLSRHTRKPLHKLPPPVLAALRLSAYQLLCMRVAPHSAVHQGVELVQSFGHLKGVVNAVLRQLHATPPDAQEPLDTPVQVAQRASLPLWIVEEVAAQRSFEAARAWALATLVAPPVTLRVNLQRTTLAEYRLLLDAGGIAYSSPTLCADTSLALQRGGAVEGLPGYAEGLFCVQDPAATWVGQVAPLHQPALVVDLCAAPGGKATHLAELYPSATVVALDSHPQKVELLQRNAMRLHHAKLQAYAVDCTDAAQVQACLQACAPGQPIDAVWLDAPCSGMGTLRRNSELRSRPRDSLESLLALQADLLRAAATLVQGSACLIYCVCTPTAAEGPQQIESFLAAHPDFVCEPITDLHGGLADGPYARTWTDLHGADSFFVARLRRRKLHP
jgi:16S rRNA (cytosine967-C5)-methyltransferase